ncbi:hypothetical protein [Sporomusa malonica]|uniref:hypothetical protein n=1 Tax=Sporomusa malonica TaxID=112901 RepID=UPI001593A941|nr:hypothetical protein [Sporomusa malonica]
MQLALVVDGYSPTAVAMMSIPAAKGLYPKPASQGEHVENVDTQTVVLNAG